MLRMWIDKIPLWGGTRGDHVSIKQLVDDFAQYLYLPRLQNANVIHEAVQNGVAMLTWEQDGFAYAESYDAEQGRYRGLRTGQVGDVLPDGLVVKPETARRQLDAEEAARRAVQLPIEPTGNGSTPHVADPPSRYGSTFVPTAPATLTRPVERKLRRFHGSKRLDATRLNRDAGQIADEVVQHLVGLMGARVRVTIEIEAELPDGAPDNVVRTVTENCRTLRFETSGFEES